MKFSIKESKEKIKLGFYLLFALLAFLPLIVNTGVKKTSNLPDPNELYNPSLGKIKNLEDANLYIDSVIATKPEKDTVQLVGAVSAFTKRRFYHGLCNYSIGDNWITALSGKLLWDHFSAIVEPEDILKHNEGLCSQQAIVFMELLRMRGIKTRSVGMGYPEGPGHFLTEVYYSGGWHLYDVDKEPKWKKIVNRHKSMDYYLANKDTLYMVYEGIMEKSTFNKTMEKVQYGTPGEFPARKMSMFHKATKILTYALPLLFGVLSVQQIRKINRQIKTRAALNAEKQAAVVLG
ncbi:MAG TPA: transglutaminase domain-containing protein [Bacteroidia bacterium]